jgi:hypothetical protein
VIPERKEFDHYTKEDLQKVADMINASKRPFLYVGGGAVISGAQDEVRALIRKIDSPACDSLLGKGVVDATDPQSLSDAETAGRRQVREIMAFFRDYVPGAEDVRLLSTASTIGIRETRHVAGEYRLDKDDVIEGRVPSDSVFLCSNSIDLHAGGKDKSGTVYMTIRDGDWYGVPYRCLVPQKVEGLLVAGRCVSASSAAAAAIRVMPPCMAMGQAAGTAAAIAVKSGTAPRGVAMAELVASLKKDGVWLG